MSSLLTGKSEDSDEDLLMEAKAGNRTAMTALFQRYAQLIFGIALKYHKVNEVAEDAVMEIYIKYQQKIKTHSVENFRPWIYVLAKHHCLEQLRKSQRDREKKEAYTFMQNADSFHPYEEDLKEKQLQKMEICIEKLKNEQRQLIQFFYLEQKSYKEISELLSLSWEKVRSRIQNGRRNLKICIETLP